MISLKQSYNYTTSNYSTQNSKGWNKINQSETYLHTHACTIYCILFTFTYIVILNTFPKLKSFDAFLLWKNFIINTLNFPEDEIVLAYLKFDYSDDALEGPRPLHFEVDRLWVLVWWRYKSL